MTIFRYNSALGVFLTVLTGCNSGSGPDSRICENVGVPRKVTAESSFGEKREAMKDCARAEAYRLHRAPGSNEEIAKVILAVCSQELNLVRNQLLKDRNVEGVDKLLASGEMTMLFGAFAEYQVARARAGNCNPPTENGKK